MKRYHSKISFINTNTVEFENTKRSKFTHYGIINSYFGESFKEAIWNEIAHLDKKNYSFWIEVYEITDSRVFNGKQIDIKKLVYSKNYA